MTRSTPRTPRKTEPPGGGHEAGQSMVEFALILVPLLMLVLGAVDLGFAVFYNNMLSNAARAGARAGLIVSRTDDEICARAVAALRLPGVAATTDCGPAGDLSVRVQREADDLPPTPVTVTVRYTFRPVTPVGTLASGGSIALSATSTMYLEGES